MKHAYTEQNIIQFIYKECDLFEKLELEFALEDDSTLMNSYLELYLGYKVLPKVLFKPKKRTIENILAYSKK